MGLNAMDSQAFTGIGQPRVRGPGIKVGDVWLVILSLVSSFVLLGGLIGLLLAFDGQPIFDSGVVTLNTLVAIITTGYRASITHVLGFVVSQSKWVAFANGRRRLLDLDRIESAGQGPLGSMLLLFNTKVKGIGIIRFGALLTVVSIAIDPFAQQLLQYRQTTSFIRDASGRTTIARAGRYSRGSEARLTLAQIQFVEGNSTSLYGPATNIPIITDADFSMQSAMMYGLIQPLAAVSQQANFSCPSGNCTYPEFASLAVCSACADISNLITIDQVSSGSRMNISLDRTVTPPSADRTTITRYSLPNDLRLDNSLLLSLRGTTNASRSLAFPGLETLIWSQTILRHPPSTNTTYLGSSLSAVTATECALYYCVKTYNTTVTNGILTSSASPMKVDRDPSSWELRSFSNSPAPTLPATRQKDISYHPRFSFPLRTDLSLGGYNISQAAVNSISHMIQRTLASCTAVTRNCTTTLEAVADNWAPLNGFYMTVRNEVQFEPSVAGVFWNGDINSTFESVAESLSNAIRSGGDADGQETVEGQVGVLIVRYQVDWWWIILHGAVVVGVLVMMVWVLIKTGHDVPVWGSSTLAVLKKGEEAGALLGGAERVEEMEDRAREVEVVLFGGERLGGRVGERESDEELWRR
ncbi:hypothetical protein OQA88_7661 [Cercophora sp. LCS_1]